MCVCILLANQIDQLLRLRLRPEETEHVVSYLKNAKTSQSHNLLMMHYLQQSKVIDAIQLESVYNATTVSILYFAVRSLLIATCLLG